MLFPSQPPHDGDIFLSFLQPKVFENESLMCFLLSYSDLTAAGCHHLAVSIPPLIRKLKRHSSNLKLYFYKVRRLRRDQFKISVVKSDAAETKVF